MVKKNWDFVVVVEIVAVAAGRSFVEWRNEVVLLVDSALLPVQDPSSGVL